MRQWSPVAGSCGTRRNFVTGALHKYVCQVRILPDPSFRSNVKVSFQASWWLSGYPRHAWEVRTAPWGPKLEDVPAEMVRILQPSVRHRPGRLPKPGLSSMRVELRGAGPIETSLSSGCWTSTLRAAADLVLSVHVASSRRSASGRGNDYRLVSAIVGERSPGAPVLHLFADPYLTVRRHTRCDHLPRPCESARQSGGVPGHPRRDDPDDVEKAPNGGANDLEARQTPTG